MADPCLDLIRARGEPAALRWLAGALERIGAEASPPAAVRSALLAAHAGAARRLGDAPVVPDPAERRALGAAGLPVPEGAALGQLGRAVLLRAALAALPEAAHADCVRELYQRGDSREREALLRSLPLLPDPGRFVATAVEACRNHVQSVFEAIACGSDYAARHFPETQFNQLVLKAVFTGVPLARIAGLDGRITPELARMARDYASERRAAGRDVPHDLARITGERAGASHSEGALQ